MTLTILATMSGLVCGHCAHLKKANPLLCRADADWFKLIGAVGGGEGEQFIIGTETVRHLAKKIDEFCPFANDLKRNYGNSEGRIFVTVKRFD